MFASHQLETFYDFTPSIECKANYEWIKKWGKQNEKIYCNMDGFINDLDCRLWWYEFRPRIQ